MTEVRAVAPLGMLGFGIPKDSFARALATRPHFLGVDAGSTDSGPHKLGGGHHDVSDEVTAHDLKMLIGAAIELEIPLIVGSAGGAGARPHLEWTAAIVREICRAQGWSPRTALLPADVSADWLGAQVARGRVTSLTAMLDTPTDLGSNSSGLVAQMGAEPIHAALEDGFQIILAGRALDSAIFAAPLMRAGVEPGIAWHMGEIMECGALCASPGSAHDCIVGIAREDHFLLEPANPDRRCTPQSVAAHSLYERGHPTQSAGPGHLLRVEDTTFSPEDDRSVRVTGSRLEQVAPVTLKIEGARAAGYRTLAIGGIRDPIQIKHIDDEIDGVVSATTDFFRERDGRWYELSLRVYGRDGVMGALEPEPGPSGHELGIVLEVVASTQEFATTVCQFARHTLQHYMYPGIKATAANVAVITSPPDLAVGPVYEYNVYHLVQVDDPSTLFTIEELSL